ncbi:MAG: riboflavin synthase [Gammaproteobacteria bacterium]
MFTGIVQGTASVLDMMRGHKDVRLRIQCATKDIVRGDSVAISGVCLTVTELADDGLGMDVSTETLAHTTLGRLQPGDTVNIETALKMGDPLGGHLVSGHVDDVGEVLERTPVGASVRLRFVAPASLARYIAVKGSIAIDGVSLTVNEVHGAEFSVNIIPHTLDVTTLNACKQGTHVNLEVDLIARYLERLQLGEAAAQADTGPADAPGIDRPAR